MRSLLIYFFIACMSCTLQAQTVKGIRINAGDNLVLVYMDGQPVSMPTSSCFIANLMPGYYLIEVYDANHYRPGISEQRGKRLFQNRIYYKGRQIEDINIQGYRPDHRPERPDLDRPYPRDPDFPGVMSPSVFEQFYKQVSDESFRTGKLRVIRNALVNTRFTSDQCLRLLETCSYDTDRFEMAKTLYPVVVDKESFFIVKKSFDFDSNKRRLDDFIRKYHEEHR